MLYHEHENLVPFWTFIHEEFYKQESVTRTPTTGSTPKQYLPLPFGGEHS